MFAHTSYSKFFDKNMFKIALMKDNFFNDLQISGHFGGYIVFWLVVAFSDLFWAYKTSEIGYLYLGFGHN